MTVPFLDPTRPETHKNLPAPPIERAIVEALSNIGPRRPCGCPLFRFAWGQERMQFQRGRMRLLYIDTRIPAVETPRRYLKRAIRWEIVREEVGKDLETNMPLFAEREIPIYEKQRVQDPPSVIPAGWLYEEEIPELEWIGERLYAVELWTPSEYILGGEVEWEDQRFGMWENPETGKEEWTDILGPFPKPGRYQTVTLLGDPYLYPHYVTEEKFLVGPDGKPISAGNFTRKEVREHLIYKEPTMADVEIIKKAYWERQNLPRKNAMQAGRDRFYDYNQGVQKRVAAQRVERRQRFKDREWTFSSNDRGELGIEGGGSRVYQTRADLSNLPSSVGKGRKVKSDK